MTTDSVKLGKLETKMDAVNDDIQEIKGNIREIKLALESNFVTRTEFANYKSSQMIQKVLLSIINLVFGTLVGFFIAELLTRR